MRTLTGTCACPGVAEGRLVRYQKGETYTKEDIVLLDEYVTQNIVALKGAAAIVSSEGGITCHASIIAREFKIPCVVSVKGIADFPDGTKVKVDAAGEEVTLYEH
ncbi:hypothetical protein HY497_00235 [Candidatus Woesearchaeota archaeon]|nr:hypothetical protein [Candidatus Woesearchaeota archaeon]